VPYSSFEDLEVWKRGCRLAERLYEALRHSRDYSLRDQMTRAAISIPSNIAEGHERGTTREFLRYLNIAKGSAAELRTQLYIAKRIGALEFERADEMISECKELGAMLHGLARSRSGEIRESPDAAPPAETLNLKTEN
jgi:four helix bundle protein